MPTSAHEDFECFRSFLQDACGIALTENKQYLVTTRIRRILIEHGLDNLTELVAKLKSPRNTVLRDQVVDAMTTNETYWFRDTYPFTQLSKKILPKLLESPRGGSVRIWSAACSSGQEPYSISMVVEQLQKERGERLSRSVEVIGTDLSATVLEQAKLAQYDKMSMARGLSAIQASEYFDQLPGIPTWKVKTPIRNRVSFRALNLMDSYSSLGKFDVIYCRNVLIYFNSELKQEILHKLHGALKPGGILMLGASEGIAGVTHLFEMIHANPGIYYQAR